MRDSEKRMFDEYVRRIGFDGDPRPDLVTLRQIHRRHLAAIAYENLDVQLDVPISFELDAIFAKLVRSRRGGWCFEMNALLAWALEWIGFRVTRMAGAVLRNQRGEAAIGNHLVLCVQLDQPYLADVGFGDGLIEPVPLVEGPIRQDFLDFSLERIEDWWRFHNHPQGGAASFDFKLQPAPVDLLQRQAHWLQTAPESGFVQNAICQRYARGELSILRGKVLKIIRATGVEQRSIEHIDDLRSVLTRQFDIVVPDIPHLWARIERRHQERQQQQVQQ